MGLQQRGIQFLNPTEIVIGPIGPILRTPSQSPVLIGECELRIDFQSAAVIRDGVIEILQLVLHFSS